MSNKSGLHDFDRKRMKGRVSVAVAELLDMEPQQDGSWDWLCVYNLKKTLLDKEILLNHYKYNYDNFILRSADPYECSECKKSELRNSTSDV